MPRTRGGDPAPSKSKATTAVAAAAQKSTAPGPEAAVKSSPVRASAGRGRKRGAEQGSRKSKPPLRVRARSCSSSGLVYRRSVFWVFGFWRSRSVDYGSARRLHIVSRHALSMSNIFYAREWERRRVHASAVWETLVFGPLLCFALLCCSYMVREESRLRHKPYSPRPSTSLSLPVDSS